MSAITSVPVVDVNKENITELWPSLMWAVRTSLFVALDLELSGIGSRKEINAKAVDDRYKAIASVAASRAVISVGLSCFLHDRRTEETGQLKFKVQTFNILAMCSESYIVEPSSIQFLITHGFDFNRQYALGVPFYKGNDKPPKEEPEGISLRQLITQIVLHKKPIVLHNGFIDLVFLYQCFYAELPRSLQIFVADLSEMFSAGIYDTKFISEFKASMPASYLEYVFRKRQRESASKEAHGKPYVSVDFQEYNEKHLVDHGECALRSKLPGDAAPVSVCKNFARYGWCTNGTACPSSHDVDDILDAEATKQQKRRQKVQHSNQPKDSEAMGDVDGDVEEMEHNGKLDDHSNSCDVPPLVKRTTGLHRAGYDAFMTGYSFATFLLSYAKKCPSAKGLEIEYLGLEQIANKVFLSGKSVPLQIQASHFAKHSPQHREKYSALFGKQSEISKEL
uniref:Target of EGR1 protein 1 n=1 Tax=Ornithodoros turicata TaxID=34597 RepID=A0A2R5L584_9ACAR